MSPKLIMFCYFSFILGHILCLMLEGEWLGGSEESIVESLIGFKITSFSGWEIPKAAVGFFTVGIPNLIMWNYSFLEGPLAIFRISLLFAISVGVVWGFIVTFASFIYGLAGKVLGW